MEVAGHDDVHAVIEMRDDLARWLLSRGIRQWLPGEFSAERAAEWVEERRLHVARAGDGIEGVVAVLDHDAIWPDDHEGAGYIHLPRVAELAEVGCALLAVRGDPPQISGPPKP